MVPTCGGVALLLGGVTQRPIPLLLLLVAACAERVVDPIGGMGLPSELHVSGTAAGPRGDGGSIACDFDLRTQLALTRRAPGFMEYTGTMGGEARRNTLDSTGAGSVGLRGLDLRTARHLQGRLRRHDRRGAGNVVGRRDVIGRVTKRPSLAEPGAPCQLNHPHGAVAKW